MSLLNSKIEPARLYEELKSLAANRPQHLQAMDDLGNLQQEVQIWLGRLFALIQASGEIVDTARLRIEMSELLTIRHDRGLLAEREIWAIFHRALAMAELAAPVSARGAFIVVGGHFDAFSALSKVLGSAKRTVLVVDPYLDEVILTDFLPLVAEMVCIQLLSDKASVKSSLQPAVSRWNNQYGTTRPVEARKSSPRQLHDRLIMIDGNEVWIVTQSFKDFAARAHGSIEKASSEASKLKIEAYNSIWATSKQL